MLTLDQRLELALARSERLHERLNGILQLCERHLSVIAQALIVHVQPAEEELARAQTIVQALMIRPREGGTR